MVMVKWETCGCTAGSKSLEGEQPGRSCTSAMSRVTLNLKLGPRLKSECKTMNEWLGVENPWSNRQ